MKFLYSNLAPNENIQIQNEGFLHLKARRVKVGDRIDVRNLKDGLNHIYEIVNFDRKSVELNKIFSQSVENQNINFNLAWAVIEPKIIEKILPSLNEMGVGKIIFFYSDFSQKNFKLDFNRFERILISSCEQCGRNELMKFELFSSLEDILKSYPNTALIDFEGIGLEMHKNELLCIGAEGGFSKRERELVDKKFKLSAKNILRSQTAVLGIAAKILI